MKKNSTLQVDLPDAAEPDISFAGMTNIWEKIANVFKGIQKQFVRKQLVYKQQRVPQPQIVIVRGGKVAVAPIQAVHISCKRNGQDWQALSMPCQENGTVVVYDPNGNALKLYSKDIVAQGGEGVIYSFSRNPAFLIKVCKPEHQQDVDQMKEFRNRLDAMLTLEECRNNPAFAWPQMPVFDARKNSIGFVMRKTSGRTLRALYAPCQVKRFFPCWDRLDVAKVALNLVNAIQLLAKHRVLVNDFNPDNFLIDSSGHVRLIDCDSFQIPGTGKTQSPFLTRVFMPEYSAPELLFHPELFDKERTPEQVRFSLTLVVYMILMSGLHPYAQCGGGDPVENLKSGRCPLDKNSGVRMPVGWCKSVSWLTPGLKRLFIRMFVNGHHDPHQRPMVSELKAELENFIDVMLTSRNKNQRAILPETTNRKAK